jgi:hypothetical protein
VDGFYTAHLKRPLPRHAERLMHVEEETPVAMWAHKEWTHEIHVVQCLSRDVVGLRCDSCVPMRYTRFHGAAPSGEVLGVELGGEGRCLYDEIERVHSNALLALLKNMPEHGVF